MNDQPLHIKYRFQSLEDFWANDDLKVMLTTKLASQAPPHTFFFVGPKGCGKTSLSRWVAQEMGCNMEFDYEELNISQIGGKDESGRIQREMHLMPHGEVKVYCLDECQEASRQFFQGMLKATEEPPTHIKFVFCTTEAGKLPVALKRRGPVFEVQAVSGPAMREGLYRILELEGMWPNDAFPTAVVDEIVAQAEGSPGVALKLLDQVIDIPDPDAMVKAVKSMGLSQEGQATLRDLCQALLNGPTKAKDAGWSVVAKMIRGLPEGEDPERIRRYVFKAAESELLNNGSEQAGVVCNAFCEPFFNNAGMGLVFASWRCFR